MIASISYWDACIDSSAKPPGCGKTLTEDQATGQTIDGVKIVNRII